MVRCERRAWFEAFLLLQKAPHHDTPRASNHDILSCFSEVPEVSPTKKGAARRPYFLPEECLLLEVAAAYALDRIILEPEEIPRFDAACRTFTSLLHAGHTGSSFSTGESV